jgi:ribosome-associated protein
VATTRGRVRARKPAKKKIDKRSLAAAVECARIADASRGSEIVVLHIEEKIFVTDYFVIVNATNKRQVQAIAQDVADYMRKTAGYKEVHVEGRAEASWVLVDCGAVVVHIFMENLRSYYDLELLWGDAPKVEWREKKKKRAVKAKE